MDGLPDDTRREIVKMTSERIRLRLTREGYDEEQIIALDRNDLLRYSGMSYFVSPC